MSKRPGMRVDCKISAITSEMCETLIFIDIIHEFIGTFEK